MANGHGGYRKPTNPAAVSGPGAHSRRTDGQPSLALTGQGYGQGQDFQSIESGAKIDNSGQQAAQAQVSQSQGSAPASPLVPMGAPSQQPGTPVTDGAAMGPGAGTSALGLSSNLTQMDSESLRKYLPNLIDIAMRDDTPDGTKQWVRSIVANLSSNQGF